MLTLRTVGEQRFEQRKSCYTQCATVLMNGSVQDDTKHVCYMFWPLSYQNSEGVCIGDVLGVAVVECEFIGEG